MDASRRSIADPCAGSGFGRCGGYVAGGVIHGYPLFFMAESGRRCIASSPRSSPALWWRRMNDRSHALRGNAAADALRSLQVTRSLPGCIRTRGVSTLMWPGEPDSWQLWGGARLSDDPGRINLKSTASLARIALRSGPRGRVFLV
jgi:hypothetical protein